LNLRKLQGMETSAISV